MIDVVMITTNSRPGFLEQSIDSLYGGNCPVGFRLVLVEDSCIVAGYLKRDMHIFHNLCSASASRNIGASSIPKYRRQEYVMFLDDDVYMCPGWDEKLMELAAYCDRSIISGYCHPYNQMEGRLLRPVSTPVEHSVHYGVPLVISSVCMLMPWDIWDDVGFFQEPGGPGGSEDYDYCMRAKAKGYGFAVTEPQCVIHTGLTSSSGKRIVGYDEMAQQNERLIEAYGLKGKVVYE